MKVLAILLLVCLVGGCSTASGAADWSRLAIDSIPTFQKGKCGQELVWRKQIAIHQEVEIEGILLVKPVCTEPKKDP